MADATRDIAVKRRDGDVLAFGLGAAKKVYQGTLIVRESSTGYVEKGSDAATKQFVGVAYEGKDNTAGAAGDKSVCCYRRGVFTFAYTGTAPALGAMAFVSDDQTVKATGDAPCGRVVGLDTSAGTVDIDIEIDGAPTAVAMGNANAEIGGLTISAAYDQAEVTALRDKVEELADDVRNIYAALVGKGSLS